MIAATSHSESATAVTIDTAASMSAPPALLTAERTTSMMSGIPPTTTTATRGARIAHSAVAETAGSVSARVTR